MAQVPRAKRPDKTKYTLLVDREIQDYQLRLKRNTNVNFSDLVRAAIKKVASDPQLEAELFTSIGGGYYDDDESDAVPAQHPTVQPAVQPAGPLDVEGQDGDFWPAEA